MLVAGRRGDGGESELFHELRSGDGLTGVVGLLGERPIRYTGGVICAGGAREVARGLVALLEGAEEAILDVVDVEEVEDDRPLEEGVTKEDATAAVLVLADEPDDESRTLDDDPILVANLLRLPPGCGTDGGEMSSPGP